MLVQQRRQHSSIYSRSLLKTNGDTQALQEHDRNTAWMDECKLSFKFPAVLRQNFVELSENRREWAGRRKRNMSLLCRASSTKQSKAEFDQKVGNHSSFLTFITSGIPTQLMKLTVVKAHDMGPKIHSVLLLFSSETCQQNVLQESSATGQTILCGRPLEIAPHAPANQADFRASGDRLLDQGQQQKGIDLMRNCVVSIFFVRKSLTKDYFCVKRMVRRWTHAQRSCAVNKETLTPPRLVVIDETIQCEKCKREQQSASRRVAKIVPTTISHRISVVGFLRIKFHLVCTSVNGQGFVGTYSSFLASEDLLCLRETSKFHATCQWFGLGSTVVLSLLVHVLLGRHLSSP